MSSPKATRIFLPLAFSWLILISVPQIASAGADNQCVYVNDDVYHAESYPNSIDGYLITSTSQSYLPPVLTGGESNGASEMLDVVLSPTKNILYASDSYSGDISAMQIDSNTCQLSPVGNYSTDGADGGGIGLAVSPDGKHIYAVGVNHAEIRLFNIMPDGSLSAVRQKIALPNRPSGMVISPDGMTLAVAIRRLGRSTGKEVLTYSINDSSGQLTLISNVMPNGYPGSLVIDSRSKYLYVQQPIGSQIRIAVYEIGQGSTLTFQRTYNFTQVTGSATPSGMVFSRGGKYLYVSNPQDASVSTIEVNVNTGALKYVTTSADGVVEYEYPLGLALTEDGTSLFSGNLPGLGGSNIGYLAASKDGTLISLGLLPTTINSSPAWITVRSF